MATHKMAQPFRFGTRTNFTLVVSLTVGAMVTMMLLVYIQPPKIRGKPKPVPKEWDPSLTCDQPPGGFKAWRDGLVTVLKPEISRDCQKLINNDQEEIERVKNESKAWKNELSDDKFCEQTSNCSWLQEELFNNLYNTQLEKQFPLAFAFIICKSPQQVFRLIKVLYRQQNTYCVHYDAKTPDEFKEVFNNMAKCLDNVFIATTISRVDWGSSNVMKAQMNCFSDLVNLRPTLPAHRQWKYALNLCGTELPVATNHEIVSFLSTLNGSSSVMASIQKKNTGSWKRIHSPIPHNMSLCKSFGYNPLSYEFLAYLVKDPIGMEMYRYFLTVHVADEHFYSTVYRHPGVPGGYREELKDKYREMSKATWTYSKQSIAACRGKVVHSICVCAAGDLPKIISTAKKYSNLFHNKYSIKMDHTAMDCMEERIVKRNQEEYRKDCKLDPELVE